VYGPVDDAATPSFLDAVKYKLFTFMVRAYPGCPGKKVVK